VDVDTGKNADNGVLDVDVKRNGDADTKAQDHGNMGSTMGSTTGTATGTTGSTGTTGTTGSYNGTSGNSSNLEATSDAAAGDQSNLPNTASDMPLLGLIGMLSLAGALALRSNR
jgi:LPXTG-motif cell wall-anchored protein